jgi:uncharacterized protein involved in outer membrane biogenesis
MALSTAEVYHSPMKRPLIVLLAVVAVLFGLMLAAGLVASSVVSGSGQARLAASLSETLGVPVTVGSASFDLTQWFLLRPSITVQEIAIGNPPGFRSPHMLEARKLSAQIALLPLLHKIVDVRSIEIDRPQILVETSGSGVSNIEALLRKEKTKSGAASGGSGSEATATALQVDEFSVKSGEIELIHTGTAAAAKMEISDINLRVGDFSRDSPFRLQLSARLFDGKTSKLALEGQAGPFTASSLPLSGTLSVTIAPGEMPAAYRRKQFGNLLVAPGNKAKATLTATVKGDVYQTLSGPAKLVISDLLIGKDEQHVLPAGGEAPVAFTASKLMSSPIFQLHMANAQLRLGKGEWLGGAEVQLHGSAISGRSAGKVRNVDINELLSAVTPSNGKIYGVLEVPSYSLQFAGNDAEQTRNSLHGDGKLSVTQGRLAALDLLDRIEHPERLLTGTKGATPFTTLTADMNVGQSKLNLENIRLDSPALRVMGKGVIGFDQTLNFELVAHLGGGSSPAGGISQAVSQVAGGGQGGGGGIPVSVTGTVESPQVRPNVGKVVKNVAEGLLGSFLKKQGK